ncbi:MAG: sigma-70 family RNA polymerase sigma factor [Actinomycetota bacterium]
MSEEQRDDRPQRGSVPSGGATDRSRRRAIGDPRTDQELLLASGVDPEAFGELYRRHINGVAGYFGRRVLDPHVTAELAAETFAQALAGRDRFDPARGEVRAWIFGIAANQLRRYWRTRRIDQSARRRLGIDTAVDQASVDALGQVIDRIDASGLVELLDELPRRQRAAVRLRVVERADYADIAAQLGVKEGAVRVLVHRGLRRLAGLHERRQATRGGV